MTSPRLLRLPEPSEAQIQASVKRVLRDMGFWFVDSSQPFKAAITPGLSDLIVFGRGVIAFIEVKSKKGRLSSAQQSFRQHVVSNGGTYLVVKSSAEIVAWANGLPRRSAFGHPPDSTPSGRQGLTE